MATSYTGFQSYVSSAPSPTSPYGRFIAGLAADDLDLDDVQHLMALAMAAVDSCQWLGWRVGYLNVVEGSAGNNTLTAQITNYNAWTQNGAWTFQTGNVEFKGPTYMGAGATMHIGSNTFGVGHLLVDGSGSGSGSDIVASGGADINVTGAGGVLGVLSGAELLIDSASSAQVSGPITRIGANAVMVCRAEATARNTTGTIDVSVNDTFFIDNTAAGVIATLATPVTPIDSVTFYAMAHNNQYGLKIPGASGSPGTFCIFEIETAGNYAAITIRHTGTRWIVLSVVGEGTTITTDYTKII